VALERGADAKRDDRRVVGRANADDGLHVTGVLRIDHRVGRLVGHPGQRIAVLLAHGERGHDAVAESGGKRGNRRRYPFGVARFTLCFKNLGRARHRNSPCVGRRKWRG